MLERAPEYAQILCFDVPIEKEAEDLANQMGVRIFTANIIYHLFDQFKAYMANLEEEKRKELAPSAVFPCHIKMVPDAIFNKKSPLVLGIDVMDGVLKIGTPLCVVSKELGTVSLGNLKYEIVIVGKVTSIEVNHKTRSEIRKGDPSASVKIECANYETPKTYGRHFTQDDEIYSMITRASIDVLKSNFRDQVSKEEWALVVKLKKILSIG
jgi:translation initiation factor 5B